MISNTEEHLTSDNNDDRSEAILDILIKVAPIFQQGISNDCMIGITDREKFIGYFPGTKMKMDRDITGMTIPAGDAIYEAMRTGKAGAIVVPREAFGFAFRSTGVPVKDHNDKIVGGVGIAFSVENQNILADTAQTLSAASQEITATTEQLSATALQLSDDLQDVKSSGEKVLEQINKTDSILKFINDISANSNLLGLNAAIEAARAGELGRGFAVVAEEIRKMAINSSTSIKDIKEIINSIKVESARMISRVIEASELGERQAAASEEISASMAELAVSAENINKVATLL
ncbi:MAG: hypothetical protein APF81_25315 [Desulfosporosinus sp. BRH_c37]|nr:MAG: hypothetical protein APF81_25315 [Desulfosporosinus sp. BRH_c37]